MILEEIINREAIENCELECKTQLDREHIEGWLKTVAGFANADGGELYIGVEDKTNRLIGFTREKADAERNFFNNQVNEHLSPRPPYKVNFIRYTNRETELFIIQVSVSESPVKPVVLRMKGVPAIYMRREGFTNGATYEEIIEMSIKSHRSAYDVLSSNVVYHRENYGKLFQFYSDHTDGAVLTDKALRSLGFFDENGLLANGALLFADGCRDPKTEIQCSVFSGTNRGSERIVTVNRFVGCLTDSIEYALTFVKQRMNHSMIKLADSRIDIDAYPGRALFEGIINAVAHRDYFLDGTQIQIDMFRDRLEISSPGSFFQGGKIEKTFDLANIISKRRNELICGILVRCNVMEAAGTGFDKITEDYRTADDNHRPYIYSASDHFTLVLPDLTYTAGVNETGLPTLEFMPVSNGTQHDKAVLSFCYPLARKAGEIAEYLGISDSSYLRKKVLENLVVNGYLTKETKARTSYYKTVREAVTAL